MSAVSLRSHERRKSAGARLETPLPAQERGGEVKQPRRSRRVKSALETRREHESSAIFPESIDRHRLDPCWGVTQYSLDYGPKKLGAPVRVRPASPTRMHNPQPAQPFLVWKQPVRVHKHKKAVQPQADSWKFINEGFYDDYTDTHNTGDANNEVPITNLAKIAFPGAKRRNGYASTPQLIGGVTGTKAPLNNRQALHGSSPQRTIRPASPQSRMLHNTIRGGTLPVFKDWLQTASSRERDVMMQMLRAAHDDSEDRRLQKAVTEVLQPESAERVQVWLRDAGPAEQQILLHVLETLAVAADEDSNQPLTPRVPHHYQHQSFGLRSRQRALSYPVSLRHRSARSRSHHSSSGQTYSRHLHQNSHSQLNSTHKKHSPLQAVHGATSGAKEQHIINLVGKKIEPRGPQHTSGGRTPELWNHRIKPKAVVGASIVRSGCVWHQPKKDRGQHFSIHPEWPTA